MTRIAVAGATGVVGREILKILAERGFDPDRITALASRKSIGKMLPYGSTELQCQDLAGHDFARTRLALFAAGSQVAREYVPQAAESGCTVIDNSSLYRYEDDIPLVIPEVNPEALAGFRQRNIIANPNCSTIQMLMVLKPLHDQVPIHRVVVATYQSVSGSGNQAVEELRTQQWQMAHGWKPYSQKENPILAGNVIPQIDVLLEDGSTREEWKMAIETRKILGDIRVSATCVRVPLEIGHSEALNIEFQTAMTQERAQEILASAPGIRVWNRLQTEDYAARVQIVGTDPVHVSRIRQDSGQPHAISLWCAADNLRKGAALNAVQIAELVLQE